MNFDWQNVARLVLLSRALDRLEVEQLTPQGVVKYQFSASGHELAQVLLALALDHPHDAATVYYRSRPFMLASGLKLREALAGGMGRTGSPSEGRDVGVVFNLPRRSGATVLPSSGDVGAQYTPAAGWAQSIEYRAKTLGDSDWSGALAVALGGEGSVAANGFWAALTIATTQRLPLLFLIEDNAYGLSVPGTSQTPGGDISANLASFHDLHVLSGDGAAPDEAARLIGAAVEHVRGGAGPCLLHVRIPRLSGHTFIDDQSYKDAAEKEKDARRDPLPRLRIYLQSNGLLSVAEWDELEIQTRNDVVVAVAEAEAYPEPDVDTVQRFIFFENEPPLVGGLRPEGVLPSARFDLDSTDNGPRVNMIDAIRQTLDSEMEINPRVLVFGEDVGVKGGVHGATRDMQQRFGAERVFDTSLSEEGIVGRAIGMALAGLLPVPEIQFRKYADPAHEPITDIGTLRWRTAGKFAAPMVVRIPVGFGKVTGDPWHSVTGEAAYAHLLGWRLAYPSNAADATGLLRTALRGDDPTFFFEHRALYDTAPGRRPYPGDEYCLPFGKAARLSQGDELTVVTWGELVHRCLAIAQEYDQRVTVLDLRTISPWDREAVLESVRRTGKVLVVHEDTRTAGFAGEIIATTAEEVFTDLDAPVQRLTTPDIPIPFNIGMMKAVLPSDEKIRAKIRWLLDY